MCLYVATLNIAFDYVFRAWRAVTMEEARSTDAMSALAKGSKGAYREKRGGVLLVGSAVMVVVMVLQSVS